MPTFLSAHGYEPGPTERPSLAGGIAGVLATVPATGVLFLFGALEVEARILGLSVLTTVALGWISMAAAGVAYGRLFRRAANDRRGGWIFGLAFGFLPWTAGAVMVLPLLSGGAAPAGTAATGVLLSLLVWGLTVGAVFPSVHRPLRIALEGKAPLPLDCLGPDAAAPQDRLLRRRP